MLPSGWGSKKRKKEAGRGSDPHNMAEFSDQELRWPSDYGRYIVKKSFADIIKVAARRRSRGGEEGK